MPHLFVDISSHGFGHLAQTAPVLNYLATLLPELRLTLRSGLPRAELLQRIIPAFTHLQEASDFGYAMIDAFRIDHPATRRKYCEAHARFQSRIENDARFLQKLRPDLVFTNVAYLPLAAAAHAGIPAVAMCSLNWADLFLHHYGRETWATPIHAEMLAAYRSATFLRTTPGMPMPTLTRVVDIAPIAQQGCDRRAELEERAGKNQRFVAVALGGIPTQLPFDRWLPRTDTCWLVPASWRGQPRMDSIAIDSLGWPFVDVLRSVDAVVTKPGYGTFTEAVCNTAAVIYQRRTEWPEQDVLIDWLHRQGRCAEVSAAELESGKLQASLDRCLAAPVPPAPTFSGAAQAAHHLCGLLAC